MGVCPETGSLRPMSRILVVAKISIKVNELPKC